MELNKEDYSKYRLQRAKETISEVEIHIKNQFWNTAVNRMYYACFYSVNALLIKDGVETSSHKGTRLKFGQLYVKTGRFDKELAKHFADLTEKRHKADYNDFFDYDEETVVQLFPLSKKFIMEIEKMLN